MSKLILIVAFTIGLSACGLITRNSSSGYYDEYGKKENEVQEFYQAKRYHKQAQVREEVGLPTNRPLSESERNVLYTKLRLRQLEDQLNSSKEKSQYYGLKPYLNSDFEKIQFLSIPTFEGRQRWANSKGIISEDGKYAPPIVKAIEEKDIILGMTKKAVIESWGEPDLVEVAGNPVYENERWHFKRVVSSNDGFDKENRIIYFEYGRVAGWERN